MNKNYSVELPTLFVQDTGSPSRTINFCVEPVSGSEEGYNYSYYSVSVPMVHWNYDGIVNAIVTAEYPADRMQAIQNNFLKSLRGDAGTKGDDYLQEFNDMQAWRDLAKATAHEVLGV